MTYKLNGNPVVDSGTILVPGGTTAIVEIFGEEIELEFAGDAEGGVDTDRTPVLITLGVGDANMGALVSWSGFWTTQKGDDLALLITVHGVGTGPAAAKLVNYVVYQP